MSKIRGAISLPYMRLIVVRDDRPLNHGVCAMANELIELEALVSLLLKANSGIPTANKKGVARLSGRSATTVSRAHWRGELIGSRTSPNGPLVFTIREIAKWLLAGQRYSLPAGPVIEYAEVEDAMRQRRKGGRQ